MLIVCLFLTTQLIHAQTETYLDQEILVQFEKSVDPNEWIKSNESIATFSIEQVVSKRLAIYRLAFVESFDAIQVARMANSAKGVIVSQVNHTGVKNRATPNDQSFSQQWSFSSNAPGISNAPQAWDITTGGYTAKGDRIVVAVIDGGYFLDHDDLSFYTNAAEIPNNNIDDDNNGYVDDVQGWNATTQTGVHPLDNHGTHVSGIVGAKGNNGIGVTGVNWDVDVLPITSSTSIESDVLIAYNYALDMRVRYNETNGVEGAYVVSTNSSFGINFGDPASYPLWCAFYDSLGAYGILSAGATANLGINIDVTGDIPTACPSDFLVAVTNTTQAASRNGGAAYGATQIDLGAPGTGIYNTLNFHNYGQQTGTSMATPMVAGSIALMHSALCSNYLDAYQGKDDSLALHLKEMLLATVTPQSDIQNTTVSGGRLNLYKAVDTLRYFNCIRGTEVSEFDTCGNCEGKATVQVAEGQVPFSFSWNSGANDSVLVACKDDYTVTVTDDLGYTKTFSITIDGNDEFESNATVNNTVNGNDGSILLNPSGGNGGPYAYQWNTGESTASISGLSNGSYTVTITSESCTWIESFDIVTTSIESLANGINLIVFPNPSSSELTIEAEEEFQNVKLIDLSGRVVFHVAHSSNRISLETSALANGLYVLSVENKLGEEILTKVTIQH